MIPLMFVLGVLGVDPAVGYTVGGDFIDSQGSAYSWSYADRDAAFGFGSSPLGDWNFGEIRTRRPVTEFVLPAPAATIIERQRPYLVPVPRGVWRRAWRRAERQGRLGLLVDWP